MTRRNQQERRDLKRATKSASARLDNRQGTYRPNRTGCTERQWVTSLDDSNTVRIEYRIWKRGGLADFVILIQRLGTQGWDEVERFDCCHGHCHLHPDGQAESETLYQLDGPWRKEILL